MHINGELITKDDTKMFDICIVGAGAAGITLAIELEATGLSIGLIESGGFEPDTETQKLYEGKVGKGLQHVPIHIYRQRFFGGSTNCWGGACLPYDKIDFEVRPNMSRSGWPIPFDEVYRYYKQASTYAKIGRPIFDETVFPGGDVIEGISETEEFITKYWRLNQPPPNFGKIYRERIIKSKNITLITNANVTDLQLSADQKKIEKVEIKTLSGNRFYCKSRNFILSMGGMETARVMLASNHVNSNGVGNDNDLVGRFYSAHVSSNHGIIVFRPNIKIHTDYEGLQDDVLGRRFLSLNDETIRREGLLNCKLTLEPLSLAPENNLTETIYSLISRNSVSSTSSLFGLPKGAAYSINGAWEQIPNPDSRVRLGTDVDQLGMPKIILESNMFDQDLKSYMKTYELLAMTLGRLGLGRLYYDKTGKEFLDKPTGASHHTGTTRMGVDATEGVVDTNCKVFGIDNLYIAGASVFPTPSQANPTFTIIAMSIRLSDYMKKLI